MAKNISKIFADNPKVLENAAVKESEGRKGHRKIFQNDPKVLGLVDVNLQKRNTTAKSCDTKMLRHGTLKHNSQASFS